MTCRDSGSSEVVFRLALYDTDGQLLQVSEAFPVEDPPDPQTVADLCARAADTGCGKHRTGTFAVWVDPDVQPAKRIEHSPKPDGMRSYGGEHPPVPAYRWLRRSDSSIQLVPVSQMRKSREPGRSGPDR